MKKFVQFKIQITVHSNWLYFINKSKDEILKTNYQILFARFTKKEKKINYCINKSHCGRINLKKDTKFISLETLQYASYDIAPYNICG